MGCNESVVYMDEGLDLILMIRMNEIESFVKISVMFIFDSFLIVYKWKDFLFSFKVVCFFLGVLIVFKFVGYVVGQGKIFLLGFLLK